MSIELGLIHGVISVRDIPAAGREIKSPGACDQWLDLHRIYCNSLNHRLDPFELIDRVPLHRILQIRIAGAAWRDGFWSVEHNGPVPPPLWRLLEYTLRRAPNVAGVVFEILEPFAKRLSREAITRELRTACLIWERCRGANLYAAA